MGRTKIAVSIQLIDFMTQIDHLINVYIVSLEIRLHFLLLFRTHFRPFRSATRNSLSRWITDFPAFCRMHIAHDSVGSGRINKVDGIDLPLESRITKKTVNRPTWLLLFILVNGLAVGFCISRRTTSNAFSICSALQSRKLFDLVSIDRINYGADEMRNSIWFHIRLLPYSFGSDVKHYARKGLILVLCRIHSINDT